MKIISLGEGQRRPGESTIGLPDELYDTNVGSEPVAVQDEVNLMEVARQREHERDSDALKNGGDVIVGDTRISRYIYGE